MSYHVLARKWRPTSFDSMVGQEPILRMLMNALDQQRLHHAYLFTGTRGVGKTTLARLFAKCLNCETGITSTPCGACQTCQAIDQGKFLDLIEVDAASRTKVEDTRELLDNVQYTPTTGRFKIYLIDEVHMLSSHSFNALLKTLEEPPEYVKFLLATTDPKRLPITILSRCLQFNLKRVPEEKIAAHLSHICSTENIQFEIDALQRLAQAADGSLRDALSLLDQTIAYCGKEITLKETEDMLGSIDRESIYRLLTKIAKHNGKELFEELHQLAEQSPSYSQVLDELLSTLHAIQVEQVVPTQSSNQAIKTLARELTLEDVQLYYQMALLGQRDLPYAPNLRQSFEMTLLRMLAFKPMETVAEKPQKSLLLPITASPTAITPTKIVDWATMLPQLNLTGMTHALASNCILKSQTTEKIELALMPSQSVLLNKNAQERIEQALRQHFANPQLKLDIKIATKEEPTPAKQHADLQKARQDSAHAAIHNDGQIKKLQDMFGATLDVDSIKPI